MANKTNKTNYSHFKKCKREGETQPLNDGGAQMVVVLTIKEMSYLVIGLFENLVGPLTHLYL